MFNAQSNLSHQILGSIEPITLQEPGRSPSSNNLIEFFGLLNRILSTQLPLDIPSSLSNNTYNNKDVNHCHINLDEHCKYCNIDDIIIIAPPTSSINNYCSGVSNNTHKFILQSNLDDWDSRIAGALRECKHFPNC